jgi:hypothetical protein
VSSFFSRRSNSELIITRFLKNVKTKKKITQICVIFFFLIH